MFFKATGLNGLEKQERGTYEQETVDPLQPGQCP